MYIYIYIYIYTCWINRHASLRALINYQVCVVVVKNWNSHDLYSCVHTFMCVCICMYIHVCVHVVAVQDWNSDDLYTCTYICTCVCIRMYVHA